MFRSFEVFYGEHTGFQSKAIEEAMEAMEEA
jgi:hypothetical protein